MKKILCLIIALFLISINYTSANEEKIFSLKEELNNTIIEFKNTPNGDIFQMVIYEVNNSIKNLN